jgi:hypothetical protein
MTVSETQTVIRRMRSFSKKNARSRKAAKAFLASTGVYTKGGALSKAYR